MYSLPGYGMMIADSVRTGAYREALRSLMEPGAVVVDLGAGTGIFALLACQAGAERVYAIEPSGVLQVAKETAAANGFGDRITFIQKSSSDISLPEPADIIIFDLHGVLPLFGTALPAIIDARERFLSDRGRLIPMMDILKAALVESDDAHRLFTAPWVDSPFDLDLEQVARYTTNSWQKHRIGREQLLTGPVTLAELDYRTIDTPDMNGSVEQVISRDGTAHGLAIWFESVLSESVTMSNTPGAPELIYSQAFFPFPEAVPVRKEDRVELSIRADLTGEEYIWRWDTRLFTDGTGPGPEHVFSQSTFYGRPLSPEGLKRRESGYTPVLNQDGVIDRFILDASDGANRLDIIAEGLCQKFADRFRTRQSALDRITSTLKGLLD